MHKVTNRLFDDQLFIADENTPSGEELALETALGMNSQKNPVMAKVTGEISEISCSFHLYMYLVDVNSIVCF